MPAKAFSSSTWSRATRARSWRPHRAAAAMRCRADDGRGPRAGQPRTADAVAGLAAAAVLMAAGASQAYVDKIGEWGASGLIFKDTVEVVAYEDPDVRNVLVYVSEMQRSFTDRISKDFFNDPSQASIACIITGPPVVDDVGRIRGRAGKELFSQGRQLNFFQQKALRVRRVYDEPHDTAVYVAYSTRLTSASDEGGASTGRYKTSICAVPLHTPSSVPP